MASEKSLDSNLKKIKVLFDDFKEVNSSRNKNSENFEPIGKGENFNMNIEKRKKNNQSHKRYFFHMNLANVLAARKFLFLKKSLDIVVKELSRLYFTDSKEMNSLPK